MRNISDNAGGAKTATPQEKVQRLALGICHVSERNTRQPTPKDVSELATSIKEFGQTTPGIVRPHPKKKGHYEIAAGSRRRVACEVAEASGFDAIVRDLDDATFEELILVENLQREDPDPKAEAEALEHLVARGIRTPEQISARLGKTRHWAERRLQLLKVDPKIRKAWTHGNGRGRDIGHFTVEMMELIGSLPRETQLAAMESWKVTQSTSRKSLSLALQESVVCDLGKAPFKLDDPRFFEKGCGPGCANDSSKQGALFDFEGKKNCGRCLTPDCFLSRMAKWRATEYDRLCQLAGATDLPLVTKSYSAPHVVMHDRDPIKPTHCWEARPGKPKDGKGKAVIIVHDTGTLGLGHIPPTATGKAAKQAASPKEKLGERKAMLQGKRWGMVREQLLVALRESKVADCTETIEDLVAFFGLPSHKHPQRDPVKGSKDRYNLENKLWAEFDARGKDNYPLERREGYGNRPTGKSVHENGTRTEALWEPFKRVLEAQIGGGHTQAGILQTVHDMRRVAKLIGFPIELRKKEADLQAPPPKTWGVVDVHTLEPSGAVLKVHKNPTKKKPK